MEEVLGGETNVPASQVEGLELTEGDVGGVEDHEAGVEGAGDAAKFLEEAGGGGVGELNVRYPVAVGNVEDLAGQASQAEQDQGTESEQRAFHARRLVRRSQATTRVPRTKGWRYMASLKRPKSVRRRKRKTDIASRMAARAATGWPRQDCQTAAAAARRRSRAPAAMASESQGSGNLPLLSARKPQKLARPLGIR